MTNAPYAFTWPLRCGSRSGMVRVFLEPDDAAAAERAESFTRKIAMDAAFSGEPAPGDVTWRRVT